MGVLWKPLMKIKIYNWKAKMKIIKRDGAEKGENVRNWYTQMKNIFNKMGYSKLYNPSAKRELTKHPKENQGEIYPREET